MPERVFIVGMYKSGTSWLLSALSAHPDAAGIREFDILKGVSLSRQKTPVLKSVEARINHVFGGNSWCATALDMQKPGAVRKHMRDEELSSVPDANYLSDLPSQMAIRVLGRMILERRPRKHQTTDRNKRDLSSPFLNSADVNSDSPYSCLSLSEQIMEKMFSEIKSAASVYEAADAYINGIESQLEGRKYVVYKSADLINRYDHMEPWQPGAKKIVIIRDGRDACISALHYKKLMATTKNPWQGQRVVSKADVIPLKYKLGQLLIKFLNHIVSRNKVEYFSSLGKWARRIEKVNNIAAKENIYVLRYEDLSIDFELEFTRLLKWLGWRIDPDIVEKILEKTSFEKLTGRERGQEAVNIMRKGAILEWTETLGPIEKIIAWKIAGTQLRCMGYCKRGVIGEFRLGSKNTQ